MADIPRVDWFNCYDGGWQGNLVPEAFAHPAKVPFALAERIYRHMLAEGWLKPGDRVVDPFAGVAGTAFHAMLYGLHWEGVELEARFVALAEQNIALWNERYAAHMPNWGSARVHQGDSRRLASILADAQGSVSSPPYMEQQSGGGLALPNAQYIGGGGFGRNHGYQQNTHTPGQLGAMPIGDFESAVSSPPYAKSLGDGSKSGIDWSKQADRDTTHPHGWNGEGYTQIGGVVSSPPYSETRIDGNGDEGASGLRNPDGSYLRGPDGWQQRKALGSRYGETPGNLGNLPAGDHDAAVSSPPYAESINQNAAANDSAARRERKASAGVDMTDTANVGGPNSVLNRPQAYGETDGQFGAQSIDTFWSAARTIVEQTYAVLKPGAVAAWICGDFVRNKQRVPFGEQWLALCVSVGFEPLLWAVAWKHEGHGAQLDIYGNPVPLGKSRVSFFRRLANSKNPEAAILNEDVIFVRVPYTKE